MAEKAEIILRVPYRIWDGILKEIDARNPDEAICITLAKRVEGFGRRVYILSRLIIPSDAERNTGMAKADENFLRSFYTWLKADEVLDSYRVLLIHSHPFSSGSVEFSSIDERGLQEDYNAIATVFGQDVEFLSLVLNRDGTCFDGYMQDKDGSHSISRIVIPGKRLEVIHREQPEEPPHRELFSRMLLIPDYDLAKVASLRIGLVGLGGLGSSILQGIAMLGLGENESLILSDFDVLEESNLSRISFATFNDMGKAKAEVAENYIRSVRPERKVLAFRRDCFDREVMEALSTCDIILGAVDSEGARYDLNHVSTHFVVPYVDTSAGVLIDELAGKAFVNSGGQIPLYVPGQSPCLLCNLGLDHAEISREWARRGMNEENADVLKKAGYLSDILSTGIPQPSIFNLNMVMAGLSLSTVLSYLLRGFDYGFLSLSLEGMEIVRGNARSNKLCPYCGHDSCLGNGEFFDLQERLKPSDDMPPFDVSSRISDLTH